MADTATTARLDAFNRLGHPLLSTTDAEQAVKAGGLYGWNVRKAPATATDPTTGEVIEMPGTNAVIFDKPDGGLGYLGRVGDAHHIVQNEEQVEFLQLFADEAGATFETAGTAKGGRRVFVTMKLPGRIVVGGVDPVDMYVASINAHDGNASHLLMRTPLRFACMNMLNVSRANADAVLTVRHTKGAHAALKRQAETMLADTFDYMDEFNAMAERLVQTTLTQRQFEEIVSKQFGAPDDAAPAVVTRAENKMDKMIELFADSMTNEGIRETAWAGFNALTEWYDHFAPVTGDDRDSRRATKAVLEPAFKNAALELMLARV